MKVKGISGSFGLCPNSKVLRFIIEKDMHDHILIAWPSILSNHGKEIKGTTCMPPFLVFLACARDIKTVCVID